MSLYVALQRLEGEPDPRADAPAACSASSSSAGVGRIFGCISEAGCLTKEAIKECKNQTDCENECETAPSPRGSAPLLLLLLLPALLLLL